MYYFAKGKNSSGDHGGSDGIEVDKDARSNYQISDATQMLHMKSWRQMEADRADQTSEGADSELDNVGASINL